VITSDSSLFIAPSRSSLGNQKVSRVFFRKQEGRLQVNPSDGTVSRK